MELWHFFDQAVNCCALMVTAFYF